MEIKFAERLRELRLEKNLSQRELSRALNGEISASSISYYELNQNSPSIDILMLLAKFFNVSTDYLLGLDDLK